MNNYKPIEGLPVGKPLLEKIKGFCPHCHKDIHWERINEPEVDYKYRKLLYLEAKIDKVSSDVHQVMFDIEEQFKKISEQFIHLKLQLELSEGQEPCR